MLWAQTRAIQQQSHQLLQRRHAHTRATYSPNVEGIITEEVCIGGAWLYAGRQGYILVGAQAPVGRQRGQVPEQDTSLCAATARQWMEGCVG